MTACRALAAAAVLLLTACSPSLATRYEAGNNALSSGDGPMYFVVISPILRDALNTCIPPGTPGASPTLVVVADVDGTGKVHDLEVHPRSPGSECVAGQLKRGPLPKPPLAPGAVLFPIGLRIDTR